MLNRSLLGKTCEQVVWLAGHFAYYAARIGFHTGDRRLASGFGTLASQYAEASGDPLLIGSVAGLRSCIAFDGARYAEAADIAGQAAGHAHPYNRARLFAYQAHALATGGHPDEARDSSADMRKSMVDLPRMAGAAEFNEGEQLGYSAMTLVEPGDDRTAEAFARERIAGTAADYYEARAIAWVTTGKARASRDPGAAAGLRALEVNRAWPDPFIETGVHRPHRALTRKHRKHGKVAEVVQLGEAVATLRPTAAV